MDSNIRTLVVEKAKQGDNSAFSTLYQMYYPKMKGICINILKEDKAPVFRFCATQSRFYEHIVLSRPRCVII